MKNIEKYKDEIKENIKAFNIGCSLKECRSGEVNCEDAKNSGWCIPCIHKSIDWLCEEYKEPIKLTLAEKCILESLDDKYKWIARDNNGDLWMYTDCPVKSSFRWESISNGVNRLRLKEHLFKFIKWDDEEPINIKELLANCEVVE